MRPHVCFLSSAFIALVAATAAADDKPNAAELERNLFSGDHDVRHKAMHDALPGSGHGCLLGEDVWLKFLDTKFPTDDEQEEALEVGAHALLFVGTERCLPKLEELMKREPRVLVTFPKGDPCDPRSGKTLPKWSYQGEAAQVRDRLQHATMNQVVQDRLKGKNLFERADELARLISKGDAGYAEIRTPDMPEKAPMDWSRQLSLGLASHGAAGAWGFARGISREEDPDVRAFFMWEFQARLPRMLPQEPQAVLDAEEQEAHDNPPKEDWERSKKSREREAKRDALLRELLRKDPVILEAALTVARSLLAQPRKMKGSAANVLYFISNYELKELEPELKTFVDAVLNSGFSDEAERKFQIQWHYKAREVLHAFQTDTVFDWELGRDDPMFGGIFGGNKDAADRFAPRILAAAASEAKSPWTERFRSLMAALTYEAIATRIQVESVERIIALAKAAAEKTTDPEERRVAALHIQESSSWIINEIREHQGNVGGKFQGTLEALKREIERPEWEMHGIHDRCQDLEGFRFQGPPSEHPALRVDVAALEKIYETARSQASARLPKASTYQHEVIQDALHDLKRAVEQVKAVQSKKEPGR